MAGTEPLPHPYFRPERPGPVTLIGPVELRREIEGASPPFLVDVRPARQRAWAKLPGDRSIPLPELAGRLGDLPRDRPIVLYCQRGPDALRGAELLELEGFRSAALDGGLEAYAREADPAVPSYRDPEAESFVLEQWPRPATGCLSYFVGDPVERVGLIIDPGADAGPYRAELRRGGWKLAGILETHTHADHRAGHAALSAATGAPIYLSRRSPASYPHRSLSTGEALRFGASELVVAETPGHTRDHLSLRVGSHAFTGDTLLVGSCGRTDLGDGSPELLWESFHETVLRWPDETEILPAHYGAKHALPPRYSSYLGVERATNDALRQPSLEEFRLYMTEGWPPKPADFDRIVRENLQG